MKSLPRLLLPVILLSILTARLPGAEPDPAQKEAAAALAAAVVASEIVYDDEGNVVKIALSNHTGTPRGKAGNADAPGLTPELFQRLLELPHLEAIAIEKQPVGDESYALLGQLKKLRDVRLQYLDRDLATADAPMFINELPEPLEILEIKHNFGIDGGCMEKLKPQPELVKLEIDTDYASPEAVAFIQGSPKIRNLQIHRTTMTDEDLQQVLAALPELEILEVRPNKEQENAITTRSLRGLANNPKLQVFRGSIRWGEIVYEGGLDVFEQLPGVVQIDFSPSDYKEGDILEHPAIRKLHEARPDILINGKLGGSEGQTKLSIDAEYNWDNGVNTHG